MTTPTIAPDLSGLSVAVREHLPEQWTPEYRWYAVENQRLFAELAGGLAIAIAHPRAGQLERYKQALLDTFSKDQCDHTAAITAEWGYEGHRFYADDQHYTWQEYPHVGHIRVPWVRLAPYEYYTYHPLEHYQATVPPVAMRVMARLEAAGILPDAYRVATMDKPDPLLCAQFGRWIIAIAVWE